MNYRNIIDKGISILKKSSISSCGFDAEFLLSISLNKSRESILLNLEDEIDLNDQKKYIDLINRRKKKEPISTIVGKRFFWKDEFIVNKNVLTPRFETELMVEEILKLYKNKSSISALDVGLGSGCILISLLKEKKKWSGVGLDISKLALKTATVAAEV